MREQERAARVRLEHALTLLDGHLASVRSHVEADIPTAGVRQGLVQAATGVAELLAIIDAFRHDREREDQS